MDRLARNVDDLRKVVLGFTDRGVHVRFEKENLAFTAEDSRMSHLLLSVMGGFRAVRTRPHPRTAAGGNRPG